MATSAVVVFDGTYNAATSYSLGDIVTYGGTFYLSLTNGNVGNTPSSTPSQWESMGAVGSGSGSSPATATTLGTVQLPAGQTSTILAKVAITGNYNDLSNLPTSSGSGTTTTTPTATSSAPGTVQLAAGQSSDVLSTVATTGKYSDLVGSPALATVATTGRYSDLIGVPSSSGTGTVATATASAPGTVQLAAGQTSDVLATVATTGKYSDLIGAPTTEAGTPTATSSAPGIVQLASGVTSIVLSKVATTGNFNDLANAPSIPTPAAATSSVAGLVKLASGQSNAQLAAVATTGSYHDLLDPPTINASSTLIANMVSFALIFPQPSTQTVTHNLNTLTPLFDLLINNGCKMYDVSVVDANTVRVTSYGKGSCTLQFQQNGGTQTVNLPPVSIPTSGLIDYWPLSDGIGSTALNQVDSSRNLQLTGTTWAADVDFGTGIALNFNGATLSTYPHAGGTQPNEGMVAAGVSSTFACNNFSSGNVFSISFWLKIAAYPTAPNIPTGGFADFLNNGYLWLAVTGVGNLRVDMTDASGNEIGQCDTSFQVAPLNTLMHICLVYTGTGSITGINYYVNGTAQANNYGPNINNTATAPTGSAQAWNTKIRSALDGHMLPNGSFSGFAVYNRQLSATEVNQIFLQGAP